MDCPVAPVDRVRLCIRRAAWTFVLSFGDDGTEGTLSVNGLIYGIERIR
jgi:hypothetical protein